MAGDDPAGGKTYMRTVFGGILLVVAVVAAVIGVIALVDDDEADATEEVLAVEEVASDLDRYLGETITVRGVIDEIRPLAADEDADLPPGHPAIGVRLLSVGNDVHGASALVVADDPSAPRIDELDYITVTGTVRALDRSALRDLLGDASVYYTNVVGDWETRMAIVADRITSTEVPGEPPI